MALSVEIAKAFITVGVQMEGLQRGLSQARREAEAAAQEVSEGGARAAGQTEGSWVDAGKSLAKALIAGWAAMKVADFIKDSLQAATENLRLEGRIEFAVGNLAEAQQAMGELRSMAMSTGESVRDLGEAYARLRREGEDHAAAMEQIAAAQKLARLTGEDLKSTVDNLNDIYGLFQGQFANFGEFADKIAMTTQHLGGNLNTFLDTLKRVGPTAQSVGINFNELTAMLAELGNRYSDSARAGNALVEAFSKAEQLKLRLPSEEAQQQLLALTEEIGKTESAVKTLKASLESVPKGTEQWKQIKDRLAEQQERLKSLRDEAKELAKGLDLPQDVELVIKKLGDSARDAFANFKEGRTDFVQFILELDKAGASVSDLSMLFGSASARMLEALIPALKDSNSSLAKLTENLDNSTGSLEKAAGAISDKADVFQRLGSIFETLRDLAGKTIFNAIAPALESLVNNLQQLAEGKVPNLLAEMFGSEAGAREFLGTLKEVGTIIGTTLVDAFKMAVPLLGDFFRLVGDILKLLKDLNVFEAWHKAIEVVGNVLKAVLNTMGLVINVLQGDWTNAWKNVQEIFGGVAKAVEGVLGFIEKLGLGLKQVLENLLGIKRETAAAPGATAEEQKALSAQKTMTASLEKLGPAAAQKVQAIVAEALKFPDQQKAIEMLIKAIYSLASTEGKLPVEIGSAIYDVLVVQGKQEWAKALNEAFKKTGSGQGKQAGGLVRGTGAGDVVPARLEPGEFVIRKEAVKHYGPSFLYALNESAFRPMRGLGVLLSDVGNDIAAVYGARFGVGGKVPGVGAGDRVPALLEPGEFVVRKDAVQHYGLARLYAMNNRAIPRFQAGGVVGPVGDLSVAEIVRLAEQQGMWWVAYRRLAMDEMRTLWRTDPMQFKEKLLKSLVWGIMHVREQVAVAEKMYSDFFSGTVPTVAQLAKELGYTRSALLNLVRAPMNDADAADLMRRVLEKYPNFPRKLGVMKVQSIIGALGFIEDLNTEKFMKAGLEGRMQMIMDNIKGLGPAKSAFALASLGIDDVATIDIWMGRKVLLPALERIASLPDEDIARLGYTRPELEAKIAAWKGSGGGWKNINDYLRDVYAAFGDISTSGTRQWEAYWNIFKENGALESASIAFRKESHLPFFRELGISKQLAARKYGISMAKADQAAMLATIMTQQGMKTLFDLSDIAEAKGMPTLAELLKSSDFNRLYTVRVPATVENINDLVTRHLENATIIPRMGETIVQAFGDEHLQGSVEALARELSAHGKAQMTIMPVEGAPTTMSFLKGKSTGGVARPTLEFLDKTLGAEKMAEKSFIRLYTERKENLADLARELLGKKFKISEAVGVWRGGQELSAMIDIPFSIPNAALATELARVINEVNNQSATIMAIRDVETGKIAARLITERTGRLTQKLAQDILHGGPESLNAFSKYRILFHKAGATVADLAEDLGIDIKMMDEGLVQALKAAGLEATGLFSPEVPQVLKRAGVKISSGYDALALIHDMGATVGTMAHEVGHGVDYMITKYAPKAIPSWIAASKSSFRTFEGLLEQPGYLAEMLKITKETRGITGWKSVDDFVMQFVENNKVLGRQKIINMLDEFHTNDIIGLIKKEAAASGRMLSDRAFDWFTAERLLSYPLSPSELFADFFRAWALEYDVTKTLAPHTVSAFEKMIIPALKSQSPKLMEVIEKFAMRTGKSLANLALWFLPTPMDVDVASLESALTWLLKNYRITPDEAEAIYDYEVAQRLERMIEGIGDFATGRGLAAKEYKPLLELDANGNLVVSKHGGAAAGRLLATAEEVNKYLGGWGFFKTRNFGQLVWSSVNQLLAGALGSEFQNQLAVSRATDQLLAWVRWHQEASPEMLDMFYSEWAPKPFQKGGMVPGAGRGDKVPALLEPGEFVVPRDVVQRYGREHFERMRMQKGGFVPPVPVLEEELIPWDDILKAMKEAQEAAPVAPVPLGGLSVATLAAQPAAPPAPAMGGLTVGAAAAGAITEAPMTATVGMAARGELPRPLVGLPGVAAEAAKGAAPALPMTGLSVKEVSEKLEDLGKAASEAAEALKETADTVNDAKKATEENTRAVTVHREGIERAEKATRDFGTTMQGVTTQTVSVLSEFWDALKGNAQAFAQRVFGPVGEVISALIGGGPIVGALVNAFFGLLMQSKEFGKLMEEVNPIIEALADVVGLLLKPLTEFFKWVRQLLGIKKKTPQRQPGAMNIPSGFKLERARYAATAPGEPGAGGGGVQALDIVGILKGLAVGALIWAAFKFIAGKLKGLAGPIMNLIMGAFGWGMGKLGDFGRWAFDALKGVARKGMGVLRGLGNWIMSAIKVVGDFAVEAGKLAWEFVETVVEVGGRVIADIVNFAVEFVSTIIEVTGRVISDVINFAVEFVNAVIEIGGRIVAGVANFVAEFVNAAIEIGGRIITTVARFATEFVNAVIEIGGRIVTTVARFVTEFVNAAIEIGGRIVTTVAKFVTEFVNAVIEIGGRVITTVAKFVTEFVNAAIEIGGRVVTTVAKFVTEFVNAVIEIGGRIITTVARFVTEFVNAAIEIGGRIVTTVARFVAEFVNAVIEIGGRIVTKVANFVAEFVNAVIEIGGKIAIDAINFVWNATRATIELVGRVALDALAVAWDLATDVLAGAGDLLKNAAVSAWNVAVGAVKGMGNLLADAAKVAWQTAVNVVGGIGSFLADAAKGAWNTVMGVVGGIGSALSEAAKTTWSNIMKVVGGIGNALADVAKSTWNAVMGVVGGIGNALADMGKAAWNTVMGVVGGIGSALAETAKSAWNTVMGVVGGIGSALSEAAKTTWNNIMKVVGGIGNALADVAKSTWNAVMGVVGGAANFFADVAKSTWNTIMGVVGGIGSALAETAKATWNTVMGVVGGIGGVLSEVAKTTWSKIMGVVGSIGNALADVAKSTWNTVMGVVGSIGSTLADVAKSTWNTVMVVVGGIGSALAETAKSAWNTIMGVVGGIGNALADVAKTTWGKIMGVVGGIGNALADVAKATWNTVMGVVGGIGNALADVAKATWNTVMGVVGGIGSTLADVAKSTWNTVMGVVGGIGSTLADVAKSTWNTVMGVVGGIGNALADVAKATWNTVMGVVGGIGSTLAEVAKSTWNTVMGVVGGIGGALSEAAKTTWNNIMKVVGGIGNALADVAKATWNTVMGAVGGAANFFADVAKSTWNTIMGVVGGIGSALAETAKATWNTVMGVVGGIGSALSEAAKTTWNNIMKVVGGIGSALADAAKATWNTVMGVVGGIGGALAEAAKATWNTVMGVVGGIGSTLAEVAKSAWNTVMGVVGGIGGTLKDITVAAWNALVNAFKTPASWLKDAIGPVWNALVDALGKPLGWLKDTLKAVWDKMTAVFSGSVEVKGKVKADASSSGVSFDFSNLVVQFAGQVGTALGGGTGPAGQIGGTVGSAVGAAIGGALFGPLGQIGGSFVGGYLGAAIGSMIDTGPVKQKLQELKSALEAAGDFVSVGVEPWSQSYQGGRLGDKVAAMLNDIHVMVMREPWRGTQNKVAILKTIQVVEGILNYSTDSTVKRRAQELKDYVKYLQTGGMVKGVTPAVLHPGEVVLRPHIVERLEVLLNKANTKGSRVGLPGKPDVTILPVRPFPFPGVGIPRPKPLKPGTEPGLITITDEIVSKLDKALSGEYAVGAPAAIVVQGNLVIDDQDVVRAVQDYIERRRLVTKGVRTGVI